MNKSILIDGISAAELLQRNIPPVYGHEARELISGKTILVTGAGGSIGSEIVRQIKRLDASVRIYLIDHDEYALYRLQMSLTAQPLLSNHEYILADITNRAKMGEIFAEVKPHIVFHAAAYKHLPLLERSPEAAIKTNVLGTEIVAETCALHDVSYLINISTDKAARPTSVLGMTKRLAEIRAASYSTSTTKVASVRFGNVLGSRGSFVETLAYQVMKGLPVTITDPRMSRYFMTIPEAAGLVIEAAVLANNGSTYVLDMGEPIKIVDLVQRYVQLINHKPPKIIFTGIRSGEKLYEELFDPCENYRGTSHPRILAVDVSTGLVSDGEFNELYHLVKCGASTAALRTALENLMTRDKQAVLTLDRVHGSRKQNSDAQLVRSVETLSESIA